MSVTSYLMGGMGNQMFQYAAGLSLSRRLEVPLKLDVSRFDNPDEHRLYSLGLWKGIRTHLVRGMSDPVIKEQGMPYNPGLFVNAPKEVSLYGYWQTEKYFKEFRDELLACFVPFFPIPPPLMKILSNIEAEGNRSVFLTVRRTDYVGNSFHGLLGEDYYLRAADIIASKVGDPCFFVFSDEPVWCMNNFRLPYRMVIAGNWDRTVPGHLGREDAELWLMSRCRHAVMANSSYSWWGAWLGPDVNGGMVIAPKTWFGPTSTENTSDIIPKRWELL